GSRKRHPFTPHTGKPTHTGTTRTASTRSSPTSPPWTCGTRSSGTPTRSSEHPVTTSYHQHINRAKREYGPDHPVWQYNDKITPRDLPPPADVRPPRLIAGPSSIRALEAPTEPAALKPVHGCSARGVHPIIPNDDGTYTNVLTGRTVTWTD